MADTSPSLLHRLRSDDADSSWRTLVELYTPLIRGWLRRSSLTDVDADDVVQEILAVVVRKLPEFQHNERTGAFRAWLRTITARCARDFWRAKGNRPDAKGGSDFLSIVEAMEDPASAVSKQWDREHDLHVTRKLLERIRPMFESKTWKAFRRFALEGKTAEEVAEGLDMTVNAVFIAKSRVLRRLREEAEGLID